MAALSLTLSRRTAPCAASEATGMTAGATAATLSLWRWLPVTTAVAGLAGLAALNWTAASASSLLSGDSGGQATAPALMLVGAMVLGVPGLNGPPMHNRVVLALLGSPAHRMLDGSLVGLRVRGLLTGRLYELPVQYVAADQPPVQDCAGDNAAQNAAGAARRRTGEAGSSAVNTLVVVPGRPETKRWWRNLAGGAPVEVLLRGQWRHANGILLNEGDPGYDAAMGTVRQRRPRGRLPTGQPVVQIRLDPPAAPPDLARPAQA